MAVLTALAAIGLASLNGRVRRYAVVEASMQPTLEPGDYLIALAQGEIARGAIVVYPDPAGRDRELIKRAVGLGGETLTIAGGQVAIDGTVLAEPWADGPTFPDGEWQIPPGTVFTLGDNRRRSSGDGRASGPIRAAGVFSVRWRYWPLSRAGPI
jgi:signal peptidase I